MYVYVNLESEISESLKISYHICDGSEVEGCYMYM